MCSLGLLISSLGARRGVEARSALQVSDQGSGGPGHANNTDRQVKIFPLEFPLVEVSIGTREPLRFTPGTVIRSYINRIGVLTEQVRARISTVVANGHQGE